MFIFTIGLEYIIMKVPQFLLITLTVLGVNGSAVAQEKNQLDFEYFYAQINQDTLYKNLHILASDEFEGRKTGELGQKKAAAFLVKQYQNYQITPAAGTENYLQTVPSAFMKKLFSPLLNDSENVIAYIRGSEFPEETLVISAHYDHMGIEFGKTFYGADDNASGTVGVLEIARVFQEAVRHGFTPKRSLLFLHATGEEFGLHGSSYYVMHPSYSLENTFANLNIDMIGRRSNDYIEQGNYIYLVGSDRLSTELHEVSESVNKQYSNLTLDYKYNVKGEPEQIYFRSDHYNFVRKGIPVIFYYNGPHADYHKATDTADKIDYPLLQKRVQLIFATAWELINRDERIKNN
ncbi:M28 family metallopeptidase [Flavobacterium sp. NKUCC04_CG]|uniref:M28 family metallopeptidase n=1 Tax=Flavobacterium sp. NKUCC04_CG TaxID=2842121 RepID=UPI0021025C6D|nr:M28 family metallopeptidase [Flavobacterium sp. NKUCC04_CG]